MYGDCQVLSTMGGSSDSLFSSQMQNPNFNFISTLPFNVFPPNIIPKEEGGGLGAVGSKGKDEMESGSGSEHIDGVSGNERETDNQQQHQNKKKRYHRHTPRQIQEMEAMFKECPHPDDKQRMRLSQHLGLKPRQVKFWFQNRRTQMKAQQDRSDNALLRAENENLKNENYRLQAALRNIMCPNCGGPAMLGDMVFDEQQLRLENARLKDEFDRIRCMTSRYNGRQMDTPSQTLVPPSLDLDMGIYPRSFDEPSAHQPMGACNEMLHLPMMHVEQESQHFTTGGGVMVLEAEKPMAIELAMSSMNELAKMCHAGAPLWIKGNDSESGKEVINMEEHMKMFAWSGNSNNKHNFIDDLKVEVTRDSAVVIMNSITLVDAFLDANRWIELFPSIVSRAKTIQILNPSGVSGQPTGSLHLMYAELQVLSPLVPTREAHFLRYCQHNVEEGSWAIVDFPVDENFQHHNNNIMSLPIYKRRPSGCLIQDMPNGYSRVTWVEQAEVEEKAAHQVFNDYVTSGTAFGARRWLTVLQRQCERLASFMARNIPDLGVIPSPEARKNLMNLSQRMIRTFCVNVSSSCGQSWTALSDSADHTVRITTRKVTEPGQPHGLILSAVSTIWLPYPHYQVFDLLRDERRRALLDVLSNGNSLHEVAHIANGSHPGNCISLLRVNVASNSAQNVELMLQESCTDASGSMVVYTTVDVEAIQMAMNGEDPSCIPLLPLGFVITPMGPTNTSVASNSPDSGCLLTVGLQVLASTIPVAKLNLSSVTAINNHICNTMDQISSALSSGSCGNSIENLGVDATPPKLIDPNPKE